MMKHVFSSIRNRGKIGPEQDIESYATSNL